MIEPLIIVLAASLRTNALGRAMSLATVAEQIGSVEIWGPLRGSVWQGAHSVAPQLHVLTRRTARQLAKRLNDEVGSRPVSVWVSKAYPSSIWLLRLLNESVGVVVDFDDDDQSLIREFLAARPANRLRLNALRPGSLQRVRNSQAHAKTMASAVTVSSSTLANALQLGDAYVRVPHARPAQTSTKGPGQRERIRIGFMGTVRPHKGLEEILEALRHDPALEFVTFRQAQLTAPEDLVTRWTELSPEMPIAEAYSKVDVAVLPMNVTSAGARVQLPAKAIDAASTGTPIAATQTAVMTEYFSNAFLPVSDWSRLGSVLRKARQEGELTRIAQEGHRAWQQNLSIEAVAASVRPLFEPAASEA